MSTPQLPPAHPFDDDKLREECGIFGVVGITDAANFVALGLHALQHRGQEAGGIVSHDRDQGFNSARRFGYVRDNFTSQSLMETLPADIARHDATLSDPDLYARDPKAFDRAMTNAARARAQLEAIEAEWLELEEKKAALEG